MEKENKNTKPRTTKAKTKQTVLVHLKYDKNIYAPGDEITVRAEDKEDMINKGYIKEGE